MNKSILRELVQTTESLILTYANEVGMNITIVDRDGVQTEGFNWYYVSIDKQDIDLIDEKILGWMNTNKTRYNSMTFLKANPAYCYESGLFVSGLSQNCFDGNTLYFFSWHVYGE